MQPKSDNFLLAAKLAKVGHSSGHKQSYLKPRIQTGTGTTRPDFVPLFFPDPSPPTSWWKGVRKRSKNQGGWKKINTKIINKVRGE